MTEMCIIIQDNYDIENRNGSWSPFRFFIGYNKM